MCVCVDGSGNNSCLLGHSKQWQSVSMNASDCSVLTEAGCPFGVACLSLSLSTAHEFIQADTQRGFTAMGFFMTAGMCTTVS